MGYVVIAEDGILQVVDFVYDRGVELLVVLRPSDGDDAHACPRGVERQGVVGLVEKGGGLFEVFFRTAELAEHGNELGRVGGIDVVVGEDAPVVGDIDVGALHLSEWSE